MSPCRAQKMGDRNARLLADSSPWQQCQRSGAEASRRDPHGRREDSTVPTNPRGYHSPSYFRQSKSTSEPSIELVLSTLSQAGKATPTMAGKCVMTDAVKARMMAGQVSTLSHF